MNINITTLKIYLIIIMNFTCSVLSAQWLPTSGPYGGSFRFVSNAGGNVYVGTTRGNVFRYHNDKWEFITYHRYADEVTEFNSKLFVRGYDGVSSSDDNGQTWSQIFEGKSSAFSRNDSLMFVCVEDTIYQSADGTNWNYA